MGIKDSGYLLGQYRTAVRVNSTAAQAANSRVFELMAVTNTVILTRLRVRALQTAAGTAQENALNAYKVTGFTVIDPTNTVTPNVDKLRTSMPNPTSVVRALNPNTAGMTGGTLTKAAAPFSIYPYNVGAAVAVGPLPSFDMIEETTPDISPYVFIPGEGLVLENSILNVTSYGITWFIECGWSEFANYF